jgi:hypothetical protein
MVLAILNADYLEEYKISFQFSNGKERIIDFSSFLKNAMTRKYLDENLFKSFTIE